MKIYEKPMAIIETIEVEDVITASIVEGISEAELTALGADANTDVILFQW
ncbi:MAG: hypothetical protein IKK18_02675 [Clostridia bacterium]|nr:hypothetical protein [Clostridia bacterium]